MNIHRKIFTTFSNCLYNLSKGQRENRQRPSTTLFQRKLEVMNNLIKLIKRNAFGFRNFENFKKRIFITLNIKKERTKFVLSRF